MDYKSILLKGIKVGVILILFTPLVLGPFGLSLSNYPKTVFFRTLVEIIFIFYLVLIFLDSRYFPKISLLVLAVSVFVGILFLTSLTGVNFHRSFFGCLHRVEGVIFHLHILIFLLILISIFHEKKDWFLFLKLTVIVSAICSFAGILQKLGVVSLYGLSAHRISGTWTNPDFFAPYIVLAIFLAIFLRVAEKENKWKLVWTSILVLNCFALILSGTRAAWVGLGIGIIFLFLFWFFGLVIKNQKKRKIVLLGVLVLGIFLLLIILNQDRLSLTENYLFARAFSIFDIDSLLQSSRRPVWQIAIEAWKDKPILGWGPESFSFLFDKYFKASYLQYMPENLYFDRSHNKVLDLIATTGTVGTLSYLSIFFVLFYLLFKHKKSLGSPIFSFILIAFFISYFVQSLFCFDTIGTYLLFFLVLGFINNNFLPSATPLPSGNIKEFLKFVSIPLLIFLSLVAFYQINFKTTVACLAFVRGSGLEGKDFSRAFSEYKEGINKQTMYDRDFRHELIVRGIYVSENMRISEDTAREIIEIFLNLKPFLEKELGKPDRRYLESYDLLSRINERIYLFSRDSEALRKMEEVSNEALSFNNQKPGFYRLIGRAKIYQKNYSEGEAFMQKAFELTPATIQDRIEYYRVLGLAYLRAEDKEKAAENFKEALDRKFSLNKSADPSSKEVQETLLFAENVAHLYYQGLGDSETCRQIYEKAIEFFPIYREQLQFNLEMLIE